jgi:Protein of unknown function (DUF4238)
MPSVLSDTLDNVHEELRKAKETGQPLKLDEPPAADYFPIRIHREDLPEQESVRFTTVTLIGRSLWIWSMKHMLTSTIRVLHEHSWSIFHAASEVDFFTSDDPVVRLNYRSGSQFNFNGGWNSRGSEIILPLTPRHLLYTRIGERFPPRGLMLTNHETRQFRQMIAKHAFRQVFACREEGELPILRPRDVNAAMVENEREQWRRWHDEQSRAETGLETGQIHAKDAEARARAIRVGATEVRT